VTNLPFFPFSRIANLRTRLDFSIGLVKNLNELVGGIRIPVRLALRESHVCARTAHIVL